MSKNSTVFEGEEVMQRTRACVAGLEEAALARFLIDDRLDVEMFWFVVVGTGNKALQPLVAIVLLFGIAIVVRTVTARRCFHPAASMAPAKETAGLSSTLEEIGECASRGRLNEEHATQSRSGLPWQETENGFSPAAVEGSDAVRTLSALRWFGDFGQRRLVRLYGDQAVPVRRNDGGRRLGRVIVFQSKAFDLRIVGMSTNGRHR